MVGMTELDRELSDLRDIACFVAESASSLVRQRRRMIKDWSAVTDTKSSAVDPVTAVDRESELHIRRLLRALRPNDVVLGEEEGGTTAAAGQVQWVVDPIDGTVNFMYDFPSYAVSIAAVRDGEMLVGAVADVPHRKLYSAARGAGATVLHADGTSVPLSVNKPENLGKSLLATGFGYSAVRRAAQGQFIAAMLPQVRDIRRAGSAALDLCMLAAGNIDAYVEHGLQPWDWAAGLLIAQEAGARTTTPSISEALPGPIIAAPSTLFDELVGAVTAAGGQGQLPE